MQLVLKIVGLQVQQSFQLEANLQHGQFIGAIGCPNGCKENKAYVFKECLMNSI